MKNDPIKHVILLKLENHSFDQMLGGLKDVYPEIDGPSEKNFNLDSQKQAYFQTPYEYSQMELDPNHEHEAVKEQLGNQDNSGFVRNLERVHGSKASPDHFQKIMSYYPRGSLIALHTLGEHFTICDRWFSSIPGPTWPNRFFALSGTTKGFVRMPEKKEHFDMLFNQDQITIFDRLNEKKKTWKVYYYDMPCSLILTRQRNKENIVNYETIDKFFDSCENGDEKHFPEVCLIEPKYFGEDQNDDHPPHNVMKAQKLIADVYNALNSNEKLFQSTLLVVYYDEHGGFYDHVIPPTAVPPDNAKDEYTFDQYGLRVPVVLVSPHVKKGVSKILFDHTSILKYLIDKWDLGPLGERTKNANSIGELIEETSRPLSELPGFIRIPQSKLISPHPELEVGSDNQHNLGLKMVAAALEGQLMGAGVDAVRTLVHEHVSGRDDWKSLKYSLGTLLISFGQFLQRAGREELAENESKLKETIEKFKMKI